MGLFVSFLKTVLLLNYHKFASEVLSYLISAHHFTTIGKLMIWKKVVTILNKNAYFFQATIFIALNASFVTFFYLCKIPLEEAFSYFF